MSAYAKAKNSKENVKVYDTSEVIDVTNLSSGIVTALNDHLAIYISNTYSVSKTIPAGSNYLIFVQMSDELIDTFTTGAITWKNGARTIITPQQTFLPGSTSINGVNIDYAWMAIQNGVQGMYFNISNNSSYSVTNLNFMFTIIQIR